MSAGVPFKTQADINKFKQDILENIRWESKINDINLQANTAYLSSGTLPPSVQMMDTRTNAEKLMDIEYLKQKIASQMSILGEPNFIRAVIQGVINSPLNIDNKLLRFLAQNTSELSKAIKSRYDIGIEGDSNDVATMVNFINRAFIDIRDTVQSVTNYAKSSSNIGRGGIISVGDIGLIKNQLNELKRRIITTLLKEHKKNKTAIRFESGLDEILECVETVGKYLPNKQYIEAIVRDIDKKTINEGELEEKGELLREYFSILETLPQMSIVNTQLDILNKILDTKNRDLSIERLEKNERVFDECCAKIKSYFGQFLTQENRSILKFGKNKFDSLEANDDDDDEDEDEYEDEYYNPYNAQHTPLFNDLDNEAKDDGTQQQPKNDAQKIEEVADLIDMIRQKTGGIYESDDRIELKKLFDDIDDLVGLTPQNGFGNFDLNNITNDVLNTNIDVMNSMIKSSNPGNTNNNVIDNTNNNTNNTKSYDDLLYEIQTIKSKEIRQKSEKEILSYLETALEYCENSPPGKYLKNDYEGGKFLKKLLIRSSEKIGKGENDFFMNNVTQQNFGDKTLKSLKNSFTKAINVYKTRLGPQPTEQEKKKKGRPRGSGISQKPKQEVYKPFGNNQVNTRRLNDGILTIKRSNNNNIMGMPSRRISNKLQVVINQIVGGGVPKFNDLQGLNDEEKDYLYKLVKKSSLEDKLSVPAPSKDKQEKDIHQFEVMKGEIMSGNDSKELIKKFKLLVIKLMRQQLLPKTEATDLLEELVMLGY